MPGLLRGSAAIRYLVTCSLAALIAACSASGAADQGNAPSADLVIRNVAIVDVARGQVRPPADVAIAGGRIVSIGVSATADNVVDGTGKFLMPGLWEMHAHVWEKESLYRLYLAAGVTGVRDLGAALEPIRTWNAEVSAGVAVGPEVITAGPPVTAPGPIGFPKLPVIPVANADEARAAVDTLRADGAAFVKPLSPAREDYFALAARAKEVGFPVAGHVPSTVTAREAIDAGQRTIEHMGPITLGCSALEPQVMAERQQGSGARRGPAPDLVGTFDESRCRELLIALRDKGVWVTPTLAAGAIRADIASGAAKSYPEVQYVPEYLVQEWITDTADASSGQRRDRSREVEATSRLMRMMRDAGVGLLTGTDSGDPYVVPGFAVHRELSQFVAAGLTPADALRAATMEPAKLFGRSATAGTVDTGKDADLVLLTANPLTDIANTTRIDAVIVNGRLLGRAELDRMLSAKD